MANFRLIQTHKVCIRQFSMDENGRKFFKRIENTVEKGEIARCEQFLLAPHCFQDLRCRHVKTRACLRKGENFCMSKANSSS